MMHIFWIAFVAYRNPLTALGVLRKLRIKRESVYGKFPIPRYIKSGNRYYWSILAPGWPSFPFRPYIENELNRIHPFRSGSDCLQTLIFAITNKCHLSCEHCFEWQNLDSNESLSLQDLKNIMRKFQTHGINQIQLSGGEPLARFDDTVELIKSALPGTDLWLLTSGYGLTAEKALKLKRAGLTGINISLDHWDEEKHNQFRNNSESYYWVREAAKNSSNANLVISMSLCAVREHISVEFLFKYILLARELGAGFIRILEPRQVGHFAGKDVELRTDQIEVLTKFFLSINSNPIYRNMPTVMYPGYHQRAYGCFGAGNRYLYVDSNGDIHACPFCQNAVGNALKDSLDSSLASLQKIGCHKFETTATD